MPRKDVTKVGGDARNIVQRVLFSAAPVCRVLYIGLFYSYSAYSRELSATGGDAHDRFHPGGSQLRDSGLGDLPTGSSRFARRFAPSNYAAFSDVVCPKHCTQTHNLVEKMALTTPPRSILRALIALLPYAALVRTGGAEGGPTNNPSFSLVSAWVAPLSRNQLPASRRPRSPSDPQWDGGRSNSYCRWEMSSSRDGGGGSGGGGGSSNGGRAAGNQASKRETGHNNSGKSKEPVCIRTCPTDSRLPVLHAPPPGRLLAS